MARVHVVFDNDDLSSKLTLNGSVYVDYATGVVYADATGDSLGYVAVTNSHNDSTSIDEIAKVASPNAGEYKLTFGDTRTDRVVISYAGQQPTSATIAYTQNGKTTTGRNEPVQACYCAGTQIATARGEVAVEDLEIGDAILTQSGALRPVKWIGHRQLRLSAFAKPQVVQPVRVHAGAFGEALPRRDLWMSPGHNVFVGGVLMPIRVLVNGVTVTQEPVDTVTYWHVELDSHDVILAEGLPAESYLDTGNRSAFANAGPAIELNPDFEPKHWTETCVPLVKAGPEVEAARRMLLARAEELGHSTTAVHDLHVIAGGRRVAPIALGPKRFAFTLPAGCEAITLASRTFVPCHTHPEATDSRVLGVRVRRLQIDGEEIDLRTLPADDWHAVEVKPDHVERWTRGEAALPPRARVVVIDLAGEGRYWIDRKDTIVALRA